MKEKIKGWLSAAWQIIKDPHFLLCFAIAWLITNGWSYLALYIGTALRIPWMMAVASAYIAFLWIPGTPEKIATVAIAIWLMKRIMPAKVGKMKKLILVKRSDADIEE